jgi:oxygen-independent coproporphyrinogen-3 oxidase
MARFLFTPSEVDGPSTQLGLNACEPDQSTSVSRPFGGRWDIDTRSTRGHLRQVFRSILERAVRAHRAGAPPWALFEQRVRTPRAARQALPLAPVADGQGALEAALEAPCQAVDRVVYVHVPFCRSLCSFCGYAREVPATPRDVADYLAALRQQLAAFAGRPWTRSRPFTALHLGGGTPTLLSSEALAALVRDLWAALPLVPGAEVTVESTVTGADLGYLRALVAAGVNRLAFGAQTFDRGLRRSVGRASAPEVMLERLGEARAAGVTNVCVDLLCGLPGQTLDSWQADLETVRGCGATGASVYGLVPFPASQLGRQLASEGREAFVDVATEYAMFLAADQALVDRQGWQRLNPVQYGDARSGGAAYVTACSRAAEVLALGAGAGGSVGRLAYLNAPRVADYVRGWSQGAWPLTVAASGQLHDEVRRAWSLGETTRLRPGPTGADAAYVGEIIGQLVELGLAESFADQVALTRAGCFWAANVVQLFTLAAARVPRRDDPKPLGPCAR